MSQFFKMHESCQTRGGLEAWVLCLNPLTAKVKQENDSGYRIITCYDNGRYRKEFEHEDDLINASTLVTLGSEEMLLMLGKKVTSKGCSDSSHLVTGVNPVEVFVCGQWVNACQLMDKYTHLGGSEIVSGSLDASQQEVCDER